MGRWEPNARGRLVQAALDLFAERGFEATTVADIAERAGLTERSFFRHFKDKREVLFQGAESLQELLVEEIDRAPGSMAPFDVVVAALARAADEIFDERGDFARRRQAVVTANAELRERELIKLANLASGISAALRRREVSETSADLAAEAGISVFRVGFDRWVGDASDRTLAYYIEDSAYEMRAVTRTRGAGRGQRTASGR